jgi:TolB-like protein/class 3 adenylate cyclase/Flp pilus assembly protein TadD
VASERGERKLVAILAADIAGYSRLAGADEERTLARLRALRGDLIDPAIAVHRGRIVKRTGDGILIEFRSVVDATRCAIEVQNSMIERNAGLPPDRRIEFRVGIHLGDVVEEADGDLMGDGVNLAARLEGIAEPGGICLSSAAYEHVRDKVYETFADLGERSLKNIRRPVRVFAIRRDAAAAPALMPLDPPRLSIAVLPFANIGGNPEQEYFVDGLTESLTTDLSRIAGAFVIAHNTARIYKGKSFNVTKIGRDLGVRYVLEGSVQRGGSRMRVNVQLIDAASGNHLWAERFDKAFGDLLDMQDEIVARLANQLGAELITAEARRAEHARDPDARDAYFQGMACYNKGWNPEHTARARAFFERALTLEPDNVEALVGAALIDMVRSMIFVVDDRTARLAAAEAASRRALSLAPNHAWAHYVLGAVQMATNRVEKGIAEFERALVLDRNLAMAHAHIGFAKYVIARAEETEAHVEEALRLSPRDSYAHLWFAWAGAAKLALGRDEEAAARLHRAIEINPNTSFVYFLLAAALAYLGRLEEAKAATQTGLALDPAFTMRRLRLGALGNHPIYLAQRERILVGMQMAEVPGG